MARPRSTDYRPGRRARRNERPVDGRAILRDHPEAVRTLRRLERKLTPTQRERLREVVSRLDRDFLEEKAELVRDTLLEIHRHKHETPSRLLQRNVWSSLDAMALHLDESGFTRLFKQVAPRLLRDEPVNRRELVDLEWDLMLAFLGITADEAKDYDLPRSEIDWVFDFAEAQKNSGCGLPYLTSSQFTLTEFFQTFCGRPDQILEIHHSPQGKATAAIVIGIIDIIFVFIFIPLAVISGFVLIVVGCAGC